MIHRSDIVDVNGGVVECVDFINGFGLIWSQAGSEYGCGDQRAAGLALAEFVVVGAFHLYGMHHR